MKQFIKSPLVKLSLAGVAAFALLQLVRSSIPETPAAHPVQVPQNVEHILEKDCYSCHSDQRKLSWFDQIQPGYWLVRKDILTAREHLNFSTLGEKAPAVQKSVLYEAVNMIQLGAMPLPRFTVLHPDAKVTPEELAMLKAYLAPGTATPHAPLTAVPVYEAMTPSLGSVRPEFNGVSLDPAFEGWKLLSVTDRGDNNTFRFILGNAIAIDAAKSAQVSPWPDGTRFAKIAWQRTYETDGLVHPGKFVQVEMMVKDAQRYKHTDGWGWGRWRGLDLKPYGEDARFAQECISCHLPVRGNDYVYTEPMTTATVVGEEVMNNGAAALPASLPYQPLGWNPVTLYADPNLHTMSALFRSSAASPRSGTTPASRYSAGTVLALVTWGQREDPHWFGARIAGDPRSVEFVQIGNSGHAENYRRYAGSNLREVRATQEVAAQRIQFLLELKPARIP
jgi:hypothetical protein